VSGESESVGESLRRIRDEVRDEVVPARTAAELLPALSAARTEPPLPSPATSELPAAPACPDAAAVNTSWDLGAVPLPAGWRRRVFALARRLVAPWIERQTQFNARQVQLDNGILDYVGARLELTHRHYDSVLGIYGRHMQDIDQRHVELQGELVKHVHDLVRRVDLVLAEGEKNRVALEAALRDVRARLTVIEQRTLGTTAK
jgi:hypothetical protein